MVYMGQNLWYAGPAPTILWNPDPIKVSFHDRVPNCFGPCLPPKTECADSGLPARRVIAMVS